MSKSRQEHLASLFERLFVRAEELHRHLVGLDGGLDVLRVMPATSAPLADHALHAVLTLESRGMVDATFFHHLVAARPIREAEIVAVAGHWVPGGIEARKPLPSTPAPSKHAPLTGRWAGDSTIYDGPKPVRIFISCAQSQCQVHWSTESGTRSTCLREGADLVVTSDLVWMIDAGWAFGQFVVYD